MVESLKPKTQEQMRALCKKIYVAHDLDPEIQDELYGHMGDKLLAYLNGEEPVTEDDAYILVREHFGDPAVLKGLLQDVHAHEVHVSLARRLTAVFALSTGLFIVKNMLLGLMSAWSIVISKSTGSSAVYDATRNFTSFFFGPICVVFIWIVLRRWQRRLESGGRVWFVRWHPLSMAALAILFLITLKIGPLVGVQQEVFDTWTAPMPTILPPQFLYWISLGMMWLLPVLLCVAWLWWCDRPPRKDLMLTCGLLAWFVFATIVTSSPGPGGFPVVRILMTDAGWNFHVQSLGAIYSSYVSHPSLLVAFAKYSLIIAAVTVSLYGPVRWVMRKNTQRAACA